LYIKALLLVQMLYLRAELFSESFQARLQHLADAVLRIQCLADNTDVYRLLPDPTR
jgi:hypothetical protein